MLDEAEHAHCNHPVEGRILERQSLGSPDEHQRRWKRATPSRSRYRGSIFIEPCHDGAAPSQLRRQCAVAAADIQQALAGNGSEHLKEKLLFKRIGDLAEQLSSPARIG